LVFLEVIVDTPIHAETMGFTSFADELYAEVVKLVICYHSKTGDGASRRDITAIPLLREKCHFFETFKLSTTDYGANELVHVGILRTNKTVVIFRVAVPHPNVHLIIRHSRCLDIQWSFI
jgi:hypothetical protein